MRNCHPRLGGAYEWDRKYRAACEMFAGHVKEIEAGTRLRVPYLEPECTPSPQ